MNNCDALGHTWEVLSGDVVDCTECEAEGRVIVTYEPEEG